MRPADSESRDPKRRMRPPGARVCTGAGRSMCLCTGAESVLWCAKNLPAESVPVHCSALVHRSQYAHEAHLAPN
eukprot:scaffold74859_cov24-Tisochrysis_lutea.AAC.1